MTGGECGYKRSLAHRRWLGRHAAIYVRAHLWFKFISEHWNQFGYQVSLTMLKEMTNLWR